MKIVDIDNFSIPQDLEIKEKFVGNNNNKILIVKNFFKNPHYVRDYALNSLYVDEHQQKNLGHSEDQTHWYTHRFGINEDQYEMFFNWAKKTIFNDDNPISDCLSPKIKFQYYDRIGENVPHVDRCNYAGLVPLNTDEELFNTDSGTGFYRYKKTNEESSYSCSYRYKSVLHTSRDEYEKYHFEYHKFNTLIMYEGNLFHDGDANYLNWKSKNKRLTFNFFLW